MNTFERNIDQWLVDHCASMIEALDEVINVEAGLQEILIPTRNTSLVAELDTVVDVEAGLAALLPTPDPVPARTAGTAGCSLDETLRSLLPVERLALREAFCPIVSGRVLAIASDIEQLGKTIGSLAQFDLEPTSFLKFETVVQFELHKTEYAVGQLRGLVTSCDGTIADENSIYSRIQWALLSDLGDLSDIISDFGEYLRAAREVVARAKMRPWARKRITFFECALHMTNFQHQCRKSTRRMRSMQHFLNDFTDADLSDADLEGMHLVGVRWSSTTLWPSLEWKFRIEQSSTEISEGIYEIGGDESRQLTLAH